MQDVVFRKLAVPEEAPCFCERGQRLHVLSYYSRVFDEQREIYLCDVCLEAWKKAIPEVQDWWNRRDANPRQPTSKRSSGRAKAEEHIPTTASSKPEFGKPLPSRTRRREPVA